MNFFGNSIKPALLVLEDGTKFHGISVGADGTTVGEVVFNTSMTGYQEILTDPSYYKQIVTLTYPHIGNVGTNALDEESSKIYAKGLIIRDLSKIASNYRNEETLSKYLKRYGIVAIADIDTRKLTRLIRSTGVQNGCIIIGKVENKNIHQALQNAKNSPKIKGMDLAKIVSTKKIYSWNEGSVRLNHYLYSNKKIENPISFQFHVVVYDYGIKRNILRLLVDRGCRLTVVPAYTPAPMIIALKPDGIFLSNGPGDPDACNYAIETVRWLLEETNLPIFGICFGHQLLALANGAKTIKMKLGHHGCNHPVKDLENNKIIITTQNHGFTVDEKTLPTNLRVTHRSLFDGTVQGLKVTDKLAFSFQGHPEASPGPHDASTLFDKFISFLSAHRLTLQ
ncbi:MAG: glutamine-hydrolyzing carbamoyl-phosphate synthase small subunit [Candidatus Dasytiphilus stammeri]